MNEIEKIGKEKKSLRLSNSGITSYLECPRKYVLSRSWEPKVEFKNKNLYIGSAFHEAIASYLLKGDETGALKKGWEEIPLNYPDRDTLLEVVYRCFEASKYFNEDNPLKVITTETPFLIPLISESLFLSGFIDSLAENDKGLWIVERKTSGMPASTYFKGFTRSRQVLTYIYAAERLFDQKVAGGIVEVVFKPKTQSGEFKVERQYFAYPEWMRTKWYLETLAIGMEIMSKELFFGSDACSGKFGPCDFVDYCDHDEDERVLAVTHQKREKDVKPKKGEVNESTETGTK